MLIIQLIDRVQLDAFSYYRLVQGLRLHGLGAHLHGFGDLLHGSGE